MLTVLPFTLPPFPFTKKDGLKFDWGIFWNYGQEVLIHDCLYRNMFVARRLVFVDMDEFIVPRRSGSLGWSDVIRDAGCPETTALFSIRHALFPVGVQGIKSKTVQHTQIKYKGMSNNLRYKIDHFVFPDFENFPGSWSFPMIPN